MKIIIMDLTDNTELATITKVKSFEAYRNNGNSKFPKNIKVVHGDNEVEHFFNATVRLATVQGKEL